LINFSLIKVVIKRDSENMLILNEGNISDEKKQELKLIIREYIQEGK